MAEIRPFAGIRPAAGKAKKIAALPYDVYSRQEAKAEVARNPESFLRIDRAETQFDDSVNAYADCVYQKAHDLLWELVEKGDFICDPSPVYYIYELVMAGRSQTGVAACVSIDDYLNGVIKKHENTREEKERDRIRHVDTCDAQTGPIFLTYRSRKRIDEIVAAQKEHPPVYDFVADDGVRHKMWVVTDGGAIAAIHDEFTKIREFYIADGHHRAASAVAVGLKRRQEAGSYDDTAEFQYFLSVLFPDSELMIMDYNRVVKDLNGYTVGQFLGKTAEKFFVEELPAPDTGGAGAGTAASMPDTGVPGAGGAGAGTAAASAPGTGVPGTGGAGAGTAASMPDTRVPDTGAPGAEDAYAAVRPRKKGEITMCLDGKWYRLTVKEQETNADPVKGMDVSLLQDLLLAPVLGIQNPKTDPRIDFVGGIRGYQELERRVQTDCKAAFGMYPTSIRELFAVADAGLLMPPKSTWFEPKLRSGLLIHKI